jgi:hypothetical protein
MVRYFVLLAVALFVIQEAGEVLGLPFHRLPQWPLDDAAAVYSDEQPALARGYSHPKIDTPVNNIAETPPKLVTPFESETVEYIRAALSPFMIYRKLDLIPTPSTAFSGSGK